jgi:hypothetical protein
VGLRCQRESEGERASGCRAGRLLGRAAGPSASARAGEHAVAWAVWLGQTGGKRGKQPGSDFVFVFLFQNFE